MVRTILVTKYHLEHLLRKPSGCDFQELFPKDYKLLQINKLINSWPGVIWDHLTLLKWVEKINQKNFSHSSVVSEQRAVQQLHWPSFTRFWPSTTLEWTKLDILSTLYSAHGHVTHSGLSSYPLFLSKYLLNDPQSRETTRFLGGFYQLPPNPSGWDSNLSSCLITLGKNDQFLFDWSILWVKKPLKILRYLHHVTKKYENKFS